MKVEKQPCNNTLLETLLAWLEDASLDEKQILCNRIDDIITMTMKSEENRLTTQPNIISWSLAYTKGRLAYLYA